MNYRSPRPRVNLALRIPRIKNKTHCAFSRHHIVDVVDVVIGFYPSVAPTRPRRMRPPRACTAAAWSRRFVTVVVVVVVVVWKNKGIGEKNDAPDQRAIATVFERRLWHVHGCTVLLRDRSVDDRGWRAPKCRPFSARPGFHLIDILYRWRVFATQ